MKQLSFLTFWNPSVVKLDNHRGIESMNGVWVVTWEGPGKHAEASERFVAVLGCRLGGERVREYVELLYASLLYKPSEMIAFAGNKKKNPYPATFGVNNGVPWAGQIICGHNPYLFARKVDNLRIETDDSGFEQPVWDERPIPRARAAR